jgi:hypothetical protein
MRPASPFSIAVVGTAALLTGCATRALPPSFPATAAASPAATAGAPAPVDTALRADPPLPGESTAGWAGLDDPASPPTPVAPPAEPGSPAAADRRPSRTAEGGHHAH